MDADTIQFIDKLNHLAEWSNNIISFSEAKQRFAVDNSSIRNSIIYDDSNLYTPFPGKNIQVFRGVCQVNTDKNGELTIQSYFNSQPGILSGRVFVNPDGFTYLTLETQELFIDIYDGHWTTERKQNNPS